MVVLINILLTLPILFKGKDMRLKIYVAYLLLFDMTAMLLFARDTISFWWFYWIGRTLGIILQLALLLKLLNWQHRVLTCATACAVVLGLLLRSWLALPLTNASMTGTLHLCAIVLISILLLMWGKRERDSSLTLLGCCLFALAAMLPLRAYPTASIMALLVWCCEPVVKIAIGLKGAAKPRPEVDTVERQQAQYARVARVGR